MCVGEKDPREYAYTKKESEYNNWGKVCVGEKVPREYAHTKKESVYTLMRISVCVREYVESVHIERKED